MAFGRHMKSHARVVVIGGGVIGCSVLYHLTRLGWREVVLCERKELTAGSSWHAAGNFHALNSDPGVSRLQDYTISLYRELEKISGQDIGLHFTGGLNIAATRERWEFLRADWARHQVLGLETELVGPGQVRELCPLMDVSEVLGAIWDPKEGNLDPSGATLAYAKAAKLQGAEIYRQTKVVELVPTARGTWHVVTEAGTIEAEHVVNAGGLWAREVGLMAGVDLPVVAMEHHYLLTEDLPQIKQSERELPLILDLDGEIYLRQERKGMMIGVYEKDATPWALGGTPWNYAETELLPPNLDRLTDALDKGFRRFPSLANAGIRRIVNGPFTFSPDGNPLIGPVPGLRNYWAACGVMAGFAQGGGVGLSLAQWIIDGEPEGDVYAMDVARFGSYAGRNYRIAKAREFYSKRFEIAYPNEYWPAGRPCKTSALHHALRARGAVFGVSFGLETPLYFARKGDEPVERPGLRRSNAFEAVAEECRATRDGAGLLDISSFAKYRVEGAGAEQALSRVLAGHLPDQGRMRLTPMLTPSGRLMGDLTTLRLSGDRFLLFGSGYLQNWHMRWFAEHLAGPHVRVQNLSNDYGGIALYGPRSRDILGALVGHGTDVRTLPFLGTAETDIGFAPAIVARVSVTGETGYEIHVPAPYLPALYDGLLQAAQGLPLRQIGLYALNSMRLEKGIGIWSREFSRDYTPHMAGLTRFIDFTRGGFIGCEAALRDREREPPRRLVTLRIDPAAAEASGGAAAGADPGSHEPIFLDGERVGFVTSGGYGHRIGSSLAMGYVDAKVPAGRRGLSVSVLGDRLPCHLLPQCPYDPDGGRMRN